MIYEIVIDLILCRGEIAVFITEQYLKILVSNIRDSALKTKGPTNQEIRLKGCKGPWIHSRLTQRLLKFE